MEDTEDIDYVAEAQAVLEECGQQEELLEMINCQEDETKKMKMCQQVVKLNKVTPTGMKSYLERGRGLLEASMNGRHQSFRQLQAINSHGCFPQTR